MSALAKTTAQVSSAIGQTPCVGFSQNSCSNIELKLVDAVCRLQLNYRSGIERNWADAVVGFSQNSRSGTEHRLEDAVCWL